MSTPNAQSPTRPTARAEGPNAQNVARRNLFTALALVFTAITFVPYVQETRIGWFMWRDAPILAITFIALAAIMVVGWWRTPRN